MRTDTENPRGVPAEIRPLIDALRVACDTPSDVCTVEVRFPVVYCTPPGGRPVCAFWLKSFEGDEDAIRNLLAARRPPVDYAIALARGPLADREMLSPPGTPPRWLIAYAARGRTEFAAWGGRLDAEITDLLRVDATAAALRQVAAELDRHFSDDSRLYFSADALASRTLAPENLANVVRLAVERDVRWRLLDVDGQPVVCRAPRSPRLQWWRRVLRALIRPPPPKASPAEALVEARVVVAVRDDRLTLRLDQLRQEEQRTLAAGRATHDAQTQRALARRLIELRSEVRRAMAQLEITHGQRAIIETHLHHLELQRIAGSIALPAKDDLARAATVAQGLLDEIRRSAALARLGESAVHASAAADETNLRAVLQEFGVDGPDRAPNPLVPPESTPPAAARRPPPTPQSPLAE